MRKKRINKKRIIIISIISILVFSVLIYLILSSNKSEVSRAPQDIPLSSVLDAAHQVANQMEGNRHLVPQITVDGKTLTPAKQLSLFTEALTILIANENSPSSTIVTYKDNLAEPANQYPNTDLLSASNQLLYSEPLTKADYELLVSNVRGLLFLGNTPDVLGFKSGQIRYPELIYTLSSILRFYKFFSYLPKDQSLHVISPKNIIPWAIPSGFERWLSAVKIVNPSVPELRNSYYTYAPHYYQNYKLAKEIISPVLTTGLAVNKLENWIRNDGWLESCDWNNNWAPDCYFPGNKPFGSGESTDEIIRSRMGTSGLPGWYIPTLSRAIGIPSTKSWYYADDNWIKTNVGHPDATPEVEPDYYPETNEPFIQKIKTVMATSTLEFPQRRAIFINPTDVEKFSAVKVVQDAKAGGFTTIIMTVKTSHGFLYYSTSDTARKKFDSLGPLIQEAHKNGIEVYAGFSVLGDTETIKANPTWAQVPDTNEVPSLHLISPCVSQYRQTLKNYLNEIMSNYNVDGFVLIDIRLDNVPSQDLSGGALCNPYRTATPEGGWNPATWREDLIEDYTSDMFQTIQSSCPNCKKLLLSYLITPLTSLSSTTSDWRSTYYQNWYKLNKLGDGLIMVYSDLQWIQMPEFQFTTVLDQIKQNSGKIPALTIRLMDEWEYPPEFYNGLMRHFRSKGINFLSLNSHTSAYGEYGPAFTRAQHVKISEMNLPKTTLYSDLPLEISLIPTNVYPSSFTVGMFYSFKESNPFLIPNPPKELSVKVTFTHTPSGQQFNRDYFLYDDGLHDDDKKDDKIYGNHLFFENTFPAGAYSLTIIPNCILMGCNSQSSSSKSNIGLLPIIQGECKEYVAGTNNVNDPNRINIILLGMNIKQSNGNPDWVKFFRFTNKHLNFDKNAHPLGYYVGGEYNVYKKAFFNMQPAKDYKSLFNVWYISPMWSGGSYVDGTATEKQVYEYAITRCPYQKSIIITIDPPIGRGDGGNPIKVGFDPAYDVDGMISHELGHAFGTLGDEYEEAKRCTPALQLPSTEPNGFSVNNLYRASSTTNNLNSCLQYTSWHYLVGSCYNHDNNAVVFGSSCTSTVSKISCYHGAGFCDSNYYWWRPALSTIMRDLEDPITPPERYSLVDITYLCKQLITYTRSKIGVCNKICVNGCQQGSKCVDSNADGVGECSASQTIQCTDADGDRYIKETTLISSCGNVCGLSKTLSCLGNNDCDDNDIKQLPGQVWYKDLDNDKYGDNSPPLTQCVKPIGYKLASELIQTSGDCDDAVFNTHPGAFEICDINDNDCDIKKNYFDACAYIHEIEAEK